MEVYAQAASCALTNNATDQAPVPLLQYKLAEPVHFKSLLGASVDVRFVDPSPVATGVIILLRLKNSASATR